MVQEFLACNSSDFYDSQLTFQNLDNEWISHGSTSFNNFSKSNVCHEDSYDLVVFPEQRDFSSASHLCRTLKGEITAPMNEKENHLFIASTRTFLDLCSSDYSILCGLE